MPRFLYRPEHSLANESGFISVSDYYNHQAMVEPDLRMMIGNQVVTLNYIGDEMAPTRHMCDGKLYTSKKKFRNETKARGCVEIGTENLTTQKKYIPTTSRKETRENIRQSIRDLKEERLPAQEMAEIKKIGRQIDYQNRNRKRTK